MYCAVCKYRHKQHEEFFEAKTEEVSLVREDGDAYFVNTGWLHRVINPTDSIRVVLLFGIDYENLPNKESLMV